MPSILTQYRYLICSLVVIALCTGPSIASNQYRLDFNEVELKSFIKAISELIGRNYVFDPDIDGKVTVVCPSEVDQGTVEAVFESVLQLNGKVSIQQNEIWRIVPLADARKYGLEVRIGNFVAENINGAHMITQVIPLEYQAASEFRSLLLPLVSNNGSLSVYNPGNTLIITDQADNIRRFTSMIRALDKSPEICSVQTFQLCNASAVQVEKQLRSLFPVTRFESFAKMTPIFISDLRTNAVVVSAPQSEMESIKLTISKLDLPASEETSQAKIYALKYADAESMARILNQQFAQSSNPNGNLVVADRATNSLIITALQERLPEVELIIQKLDVERKQVLVESLIMEVTLERVQQLGMEWRLMDQPVDGSIRGFGGTNFPQTDGQGALNTMAANPFGGTSGLAIGAAKGTFTFGGVEFLNIGALVQALQTDRAVNILSTPQILAMDNEQAEIVVGEERPFLKSTQTTDIGSTIKTFEFKDVGMTLRLTPHISGNNFVRLEVFLEIKSFLNEADVGAITSTKRQATTTVIVENHETVVIGGLIRDDEIAATSKIPCVGTLPLLGWLFKAIRNENVKTNLLIFITPQIIDNRKSLNLITNEKRETIQKFPSTQNNKLRDEFLLIKE